MKRARSDATSRDRHSLKAIWLVTLSAILLGGAAAYCFRSCQLPWSRPVVVFSFCVFALGLVLRWYSIIHLGRFFTVDVAIAPDHQLVASGPYRFIRHPSYAGSLLIKFGFALSFLNWVSFLVIFVPCCAVTLWRIHVEEEALMDGLGEAYRSYMRRTKRLIPLIY